MTAINPQALGKLMPRSGEMRAMRSKELCASVSVRDAVRPVAEASHSQRKQTAMTVFGSGRHVSGLTGEAGNTHRAQNVRQIFPKWPPACMSFRASWT